MTQSQLLEQFIDRLGLRYFKGKELTPYWSRRNGSAKNSVPPEILWPNIVRTIFVLDEIRHRLGYPLIITSSYRSPQYNASVGGAPASVHMKFRAIDFQGTSGNAKQWWEMAKAVRGDKLPTGENGQTFRFAGGIGRYATFCHIDTRGENVDW